MNKYKYLVYTEATKVVCIFGCSSEWDGTHLKIYRKNKSGIKDIAGVFVLRNIKGYEIQEVDNEEKED